jgi:adenosylcobinamide-phosphate synthase
VVERVIGLDLLATHLSIVAVALTVDAVVGYPEALYRRIRHPVVWIGVIVDGFDRRFNRTSWRDHHRRLAGAMTLTAVVAISAGAAAVAAALCRELAWGWIVEGVLAASLIAQKSLDRHVGAVAEALERDGIAGGRTAVAAIVGRDPEALDEGGIGRAAVESLAESFSDGIVAPAFWLLIGGLPAAVAYKAISTADSMIGHLSPRHAAFGWASAKLDDVVNLPASRLSAALLTLAALLLPRYRAREALRAVGRDAPKHRSPNAGWPEAAMAGALGLRLAGPRIYDGVRVDDAWMGDGSPDASAADIRRGLRLYRAACAILFAAVVAALVWSASGR